MINQAILKSFNHGSKPFPTITRYDNFMEHKVWQKEVLHWVDLIQDGQDTLSGFCWI